jgi:aspartate-semialdehyde dehydrogenase
MKFTSNATLLIAISSASTAFGFSPSSNFSIRTSHRCMSNPSSLSMSYSVGVVGATGAVGKELVGCLNKSTLDVSKLRIFGSERSAGTSRDTGKFGSVEVELFDVAKARECDVIFLAVSGDFALEHAKAISEGDDGAVVIDNSSAFRYDKDVPLVVPEINGDCANSSKLIANPNCTTAIGLMPIWPLHKLFKIKKVIMSTYQAASGAGQEGMDELQEGTRAVLSGEVKVAKNKIFAHPLPFNVIPHIDKFQPNGYTKEEMKVTWETRKICGLPDDFPVSCTAVRIPTYRAHSETIIIETELPVDIEKARQALSETSGVKLVDDTANNKYPMPLTATGEYDVEVGRLRKSLIFGDHGIEMFVVGDQLLRGAALNAVLIAEHMANSGSLKAKVSA